MPWLHGDAEHLDVSATEIISLTLSLKSLNVRI